MKHSTTYYRQARKIAAEQALQARMKDAAEREQAMKDTLRTKEEEQADTDMLLAHLDREFMFYDMPNFR